MTENSPIKENISEEELFILYLLYSNRCLKSNRGFHSEKLNTLFRNRFGKDAKKPVQRLLNEALICRVGKNPPKYYICNIKQTLFLLSQHGYNVTKGRERPL